MRGDGPQQAAMSSYISPEERVPRQHPLRSIRTMVDAVLKDLSPRFELLYSHTGRPSIAPEQLLRVLWLQVLYTVRSERLLMEQLDDNWLFHWFVGLNMDDRIWDASTFSKNRECLLGGDIAHAFFEQVLARTRERDLLSDEHFTVDGTLIEAWAGQKSFKRKEAEPPSPPDDPGNPSIDFRGERRTNATHASTPDLDARLYKKAKGQGARLAYLGHVFMENRHGLVVDTRVTPATGTAERQAALAMAEGIPGQQRVTLGADTSYGTRDFVRELCVLQVTPHVAQHIMGRVSAIDRRTTRHPGYAVSQRRRQCVEEIFGWMNTVGLLRKTRHRGVARQGWMFTVAAAVYNLVRMRTLAAVALALEKARLQCHFFPSLSRPQWGTHRLKIFQSSSLQTSGMFAGPTVNLLNSVFQQPARA